MPGAASRPVPLLVRAAFVSAVASGAFVLERVFPLRRRVAGGPARVLRNLAISAASGAVVLALELPVAAISSRWVIRRRMGLSQWLPLPVWARTAVGIVWLDYTTYLWHVLTHVSPALWRFHCVHHIDRDLDSTTATRFHPGEMLLSVPFRALQIVLGGVSPRAFSLWQIAFFSSVLVHHSNVRWPERLERRLARVLITPRMHGIHHSQDPEQRSSNWSSGFTSLWDHLHGTFRLDVAQSQIAIGVQDASSAAQDRLVPVMVLPLTSRYPA